MKKADVSEYSCSNCQKSFARSFFTNSSFNAKDIRLCMDCELEKSREKMHLDTKRFACQGPCNRKELPFTAFEPRHILRVKDRGLRENEGLLCKKCLYPVCDECHEPSLEAIPFGPAAVAEMIKSMGKERWQRSYKRCFLCESCKYPPCCGCGINRDRKDKKESRQKQLWFCVACLEKPCSSKIDWPPCAQCKQQRPEDQRKNKHGFRIWKCPDCWRSA